MTVHVISFLIGFLVGFSSLAVPLMIWAYRINKKHKKQTIDKIQEMQKMADAQKSVTNRIKQVQEITSEQNDLIAQVQHPSMNAVHSKHKNGIKDRLKKLEEEKVEILQSIIKEGHDPVVAVIDPVSGEMVDRKLSEFLANHNILPGDTEQTDDMNGMQSSRKIKKKGNLYVVDGGEEDFNNDDGDGPTYH